MTYKLLAAIFLIMLVAYFIEVFILVHAMKKVHRDEWLSLGAPDLFSPAGQSVFFGFIFGRYGVLKELPKRVRSRCIRVRFYLTFGVGIFLVLAAVLLSIEAAKT